MAKEEFATPEELELERIRLLSTRCRRSLAKATRASLQVFTHRPSRLGSEAYSDVSSISHR